MKKILGLFVVSVFGIAVVGPWSFAANEKASSTQNGAVMSDKDAFKSSNGHWESSQNSVGGTSFTLNEVTVHADGGSWKINDEKVRNQLKEQGKPDGSVSVSYAQAREVVSRWVRGDKEGGGSSIKWGDGNALDEIYLQQKLEADEELDNEPEANNSEQDEEDIVSKKSKERAWFSKKEKAEKYAKRHPGATIYPWRGGYRVEREVRYFVDDAGEIKMMAGDKIIEDTDGTKILKRTATSAAEQFGSAKKVLAGFALGTLKDCYHPEYENSLLTNGWISKYCVYRIADAVFANEITEQQFEELKRKHGANAAKMIRGEGDIFLKNPKDFFSERDYTPEQSARAKDLLDRFAELATFHRPCFPEESNTGVCVKKFSNRSVSLVQGQRLAKIWTLQTYGTESVCEETWNSGHEEVTKAVNKSGKVLHENKKWVNNDNYSRNNRHYISCKTVDGAHNLHFEFRSLNIESEHINNMDFLDAFSGLVGGTVGLICNGKVHRVYREFPLRNRYMLPSSRQYKESTDKNEAIKACNKLGNNLQPYLGEWGTKYRIDSGPIYKSSGDAVRTVSRLTTLVAGEYAVDESKKKNQESKYGTSSFLDNVSVADFRIGFDNKERGNKPTDSWEAIAERSLVCFYDTGTDKCEFVNELAKYGVDSQVFYRFQVRYDNRLEPMIQNVVAQHLKYSGKVLDTFSCSPLTNDGTVSCFAHLVGDKNVYQVDFPFMSTSIADSNKRADADFDGLHCLLSGGEYDGQACQGMNEDSCNEFGKENDVKVKWNKDLFLCEMPDSQQATAEEREKRIQQLVKKGVVAVVITVASGGTAVLIIGTILVEGAQVAKEDWKQRTTDEMRETLAAIYKENEQCKEGKNEKQEQECNENSIYKLDVEFKDKKKLIDVYTYASVDSALAKFGENLPVEIYEKIRDEVEQKAGVGKSTLVYDGLEVIEIVGRVMQLKGGFDTIKNLLATNVKQLPNEFGKIIIKKLEKLPKTLGKAAIKNTVNEDFNTSGSVVNVSENLASAVVGVFTSEYDNAKTLIDMGKKWDNIVNDIESATSSEGTRPIVDIAKDKI